MNRPTGFAEQPIWTALGLLVVCAGPLILLAALNGYVPDDDKVGVVVTGLVLTPLTVVVLVLAVVGTVRDQRVWRDLDTAGVRVMGEVTSAERVWCGEDDRCTRVRMLVTVPGRPPFTTSHLVGGEEIIEVGTRIPVDVHPTRDLFRLVADPSTGGASR
ncbi:hypothetical protein F4560_002182 [Saccharothrix ecbatanensis]|uniref:Uncharacterized protein n=1 Tax=Saccharothrix ecbatanensis TaxID=1105145 RepID=A0A7W9HHJ9_9PSEU|nr:hypothetical protein [Saccharothrix ecbatanensis]MBB5802414.1 hypothetical protein [Saccharothrix ecbatanensis]